MNKEGQIQSSTQANHHKMMRSFQAETYLTPHRAELLSWFQRNAPSLGELYLGAIKIVSEPSFPGRTRFISHAGREICNRLPDIISGVRSTPVLQYKNKLDEISKGWVKTGFPLNGSRPINVTGSETIPSNSVPVPINLFYKISALVKEHNDTREKPIERAQRLFAGNTPDNFHLEDTLRPIVNQWLEVTEWFVGKAHDSGAVDSDVDVKELQNKFELFETTLRALIRGFFTTVEELDEILEEANS